jgi:hypothetical protein
MGSPITVVLKRPLESTASDNGKRTEHFVWEPLDEWIHLALSTISLFPETLLLLLMHHSERHTAVSNHPRHDNASSNNCRVEGWVKALVLIQVLRSNVRSKILFSDSKRRSFGRETRQKIARNKTSADGWENRQTDGLGNGEQQRNSQLTSRGGRVLTNSVHWSFALCNLGVVDMRRAATRVATWDVREASRDIVTVVVIVVVARVVEEATAGDNVQTVLCVHSRASTTAKKRAMNANDR